MIGFVYILTNPAMPGVIKVGRTAGRPEGRAAELSSPSGVPLPFRVTAHVMVADARSTEALIHLNLGPRRLNDRREFFRTDGEHEVLRDALELLCHADDRVAAPWVADWALVACGLQSVSEVEHPMAWAERAVF